MLMGENTSKIELLYGGLILTRKATEKLWGKNEISRLKLHVINRGSIRKDL
jgi:hypothetical protein